MEKHQHLKLPLFEGDIDRKKHGGGGGFKLLEDRNKSQFSRDAYKQAENISRDFLATKNKLSGKINPTLIFEMKINQGVSCNDFEETLLAMGIHVLSFAEGKKGYWVVFSEDEELDRFKKKLETYGAEDGANYDFFNAIESFGEIQLADKIGNRLTHYPLTDTADFIDIELWKIDDQQKNENFIDQLKKNYSDYSQFRITDDLITKSFVLLRVKLTKKVFDEIIQLKEVSRADRPATIQFNPFEIIKPNIDDIEFNAPEENSTGILVIDSGIVANHPMLEKCVGGEENFQSGETALQDTVGHGTAVAGCAAYGDIESSLKDKTFTPSNWLFSAKVMYAEKDFNGKATAIYDPEKLIEHQLKDAVDSFLSNADYHIKVVNISLGNCDEVWHKHYLRQLPLAALIDELAFIFPHVVFIVSAGNQSPRYCYDSITDIIENYPRYLIEDENFKIINPATAALALTIGSIACETRIEIERYDTEYIKTAIAKVNQPSPFTRTGFGINGMIKPELVEYGGNLVLSEQHGRLIEDKGGKIVLLKNKVIDDIIQFDTGTSFAAPKVAHIAGKIANHFPDKSANFIKNMLLASAEDSFEPTKEFYRTKDNDKAKRANLLVCGYGLSNYERALHSFDNRVLLLDEGQIGLNQIKVYSLPLPELFFTEAGKKKITVTLTFTPETRTTRGDSYLGNRMEFHLFHSINPEVVRDKYGVITNNNEYVDTPTDLKKFEIDDFFPSANVRKSGCHQKACKTYKQNPKNRPQSPVSLVLLNFNKWLPSNRMQDYCISVIFEHEKEIELYNAIKTTIQTRTRVR